MPRRFDFLLNGRGYLLSKPGNGRGRAWHRVGRPDTPIRMGSRSEEQAGYGGVDPQLDYPEVWDDWSGGYGHAYRSPDAPNTYHWAENFDARFPKQLVHCQQPRPLYTANSVYWMCLPDAATGTRLSLENIDGFADGFAFNTAATTNDMAGKQQVVLLGRDAWATVAPAAPGTTAAWEGWISVVYTSGNSFEGPALAPGAVYGSYLVFGSMVYTTFNMVEHDAGSVTYPDNLPGRYFAVAGNQLWRAHGPTPDNSFYLQNCGNTAGIASSGSWGATYNIGDQQAPIKALIGADDQIFAGTARGLFAGDQSGTFVNVLSTIAQQSHPDNCRDLAIFEGAVVAPTLAGVFGYRPSTGMVEDLAVPRADRSPVNGRVRAVRAYGRYLYGGLYTGSRSHLVCGERRGQKMIWHTLQRMPHTTKVGRLYVDGISTYSLSPVANTFWLSTEASIDPSGTAPVYWWKIPSLDGNPLMASPGFSANYVGSARIDLGSTDWGAPGTPKEYRAVEVWSEALASGAQWCDIYATIDERNRWKLGTVAQSPKDTLYFPTTNASQYTGQAIRLSLESYTASAGVTPVYRAIVLRGNLHPRYTDEITAVVRIADDMVDRQGGPMRSGAAQLQELRDLGNPDANGLQVVDLVDPLGASWKVKLLGPPEEQEQFVGVGDLSYPEIQATIRMVIERFS